MVVVVWWSGPVLLLQDLEDLLWWNHEFCCLQKNPEGEGQAISLWPQVEVDLGPAARQWFKTHQQVHLWMAEGKTIWRPWSGQVKVLTWILLRCCGMTLKRWFMLENPPVWLNYNNSAKMSGPTFLHSAVKDSLQVIAKAWLQLLLLRVAQPVIRFGG